MNPVPYLPDTTGCQHVLVCIFDAWQCKLCYRAFDEVPEEGVVRVRDSRVPPLSRQAAWVMDARPRRVRYR